MYHIVICDDDTLFIDHMKCLLLRAGLPSESCRFYSYLSASEFEADFQNFYTVDLLILDIQLPDVNGTIPKLHAGFLFREAVSNAGII